MFLVLLISGLSVDELTARTPFIGLIPRIPLIEEGDDVWQTVGREIIALLGLIPLITLHELVHGAVSRAVGLRPTFGLRWYAAYTTVEGGYFTKKQYLWFCAAPLLVLSIVGLLVTWLLPALSGWTLFGLIFNGTGSVGDIAMWWETMKLPPHAFVEDKIDGFEAFVLA